MTVIESSSTTASITSSVAGNMPGVLPHALPYASPYTSPKWLIGGNAQTIWPALYSRTSRHELAINYTRERWTAPDADFIDVDFLKRDAAADAKPFCVLFHGLEGSSQSHYALAFAQWCAVNQWGYAVPHFRGCSGELNLAPRAYHSGDHAEIAWILQRFRQRMPTRTIYAVGVSLGGNALLRWAEEAGDSASRTVSSVCAISSPIDMVASGAAISRGFNRQTYTRMFLRSMKPRALDKLAQHPGLFDKATLMAARDLYEFDNVFTAPLHGFKNTEEYWARASAKPLLHHIRIPALVINACNDPFMPASALPAQHEVGEYVSLDQPAQGGHVGFAQGAFPAVVDWLPERVTQFFTHG
jgi:uncharacterized protein